MQFLFENFELCKLIPGPGLVLLASLDLSFLNEALPLLALNLVSERESSAGRKKTCEIKIFLWKFEKKISWNQYLVVVVVAADLKDLHCFVLTDQKLVEELVQILTESLLHCELKKTK